MYHSLFFSVFVFVFCCFVLFCVCVLFCDIDYGIMECIIDILWDYGIIMAILWYYGMNYVYIMVSWIELLIYYGIMD